MNTKEILFSVAAGMAVWFLFLKPKAAPAAAPAQVTAPDPLNPPQSEMASEADTLSTLPIFF